MAMGQDIPVSQVGSEKSEPERDSQMQHSGDVGREGVETGAHISVNGTETTTPMAQEMTSRLIQGQSHGGS